MTQGMAGHTPAQDSSSSQRWRPTLGVPALTLWVAVFIIAIDNRAFWSQLAQVSAVGQASGIEFACATAVFLVSALALMMSVFAFRFIYKPFLVGLLLIGSIVGYFMQTYGVVIDDTMIINTLDTDRGEAAGLFNLALVWHLWWTAALPAALVIWVRISRAGILRQTLTRVVFALVMAVMAVGAVGVQYKQFSLTLREHRDLRMYINPTYAIYSAFEVAHGQAKAVDHPLVKIGEDAHRTAAARRAQRKVMILVVGETTRAANWGLDGYARQTTPELAKLNVLNFTDAHSCGTSTAVSVPCMFSAQPRRDFDGDAAGYTENLLDILKRTGIDVQWEENQAGGCKGVCDRVPTRNMRTLRIPGVCGDGHCLDAVFLHGLAERIKQTQGDTLLVMHTMGSHGPSYFERYPGAFDIYKPTCDSNRPQQCSQQALINSYDNTVRYVDHIVASLIDVLKTQVPVEDTALWYLSDHGESLGENGLYLHGFPYRFAPSEQTHIPMIIWMSPGFMRADHLRPACVARQTGHTVGQDNLFSTVMAMMDVRASVYDPKLDIFAPCADTADAAKAPSKAAS